MHLAAAYAAASPTMGALDDLEVAIANFHAAGAEWTITSAMLEQAWGYLALDRVGLAASCLTQLQHVLGRGQCTSAAEVHRLRAEIIALTDGPTNPAVADELRAGLHWAKSQGAHLFVLRGAASFERWFGLEDLDDDLKIAYEEALGAFGPSPIPAQVRRLDGAAGQVSRARA
jgi:hypothetical protein